MENKKNKYIINIFIATNIELPDIYDYCIYRNIVFISLITVTPGIHSSVLYLLIQDFLVLLP
jgi:hypothetical protein